MASDSMAPVESRSLTLREAEFARSLTRISREWANVDIASLRVIAECRCGCQSVMLAEPAEPQNTTGVGHQGPIGELSVSIRTDHGDDVVSVLLYQAHGSLSLLEIIWYNFPEPVPTEWTELSREVIPA